MGRAHKESTRPSYCPGPLVRLVFASLYLVLSDRLIHFSIRSVIGQSKRKCVFRNQPRSGVREHLWSRSQSRRYQFKMIGQVSCKRLWMDYISILRSGIWPRKHQIRKYQFVRRMSMLRCHCKYRFVRRRFNRKHSRNCPCYESHSKSGACEGELLLSLPEAGGGVVTSNKRRQHPSPTHWAVHC